MCWEGRLACVVVGVEHPDLAWPWWQPCVWESTSTTWGEACIHLPGDYAHALLHFLTSPHCLFREKKKTCPSVSFGACKFSYNVWIEYIYDYFDLNMDTLVKLDYDSDCMDFEVWE